MDLPLGRSNHATLLHVLEHASQTRAFRVCRATQTSNATEQ